MAENNLLCTPSSMIGSFCAPRDSWQENSYGSDLYDRLYDNLTES